MTGFIFCVQIYIYIYPSADKKLMLKVGARNKEEFVSCIEKSILSIISPPRASQSSSTARGRVANAVPDFDTEMELKAMEIEANNVHSTPSMGFTESESTSPSETAQTRTNTEPERSS